jgi:hypothetical protein
MSKATEHGLIKVVGDADLVRFFYLNIEAWDLADKLHSLKFTITKDCSNVPFNAQLRDYICAIDSDDYYWIVKKIKDEEVFFYGLCELTYYIDFQMETLSAPTILIQHEGAYYRASKVIPRSIQVSSYNYLEEPFRKVLARDLINRWLFFDEDRNPNNYLVIKNSRQEPLVVAIDFNHIDLESPVMKITGDDKKFGWNRLEKTRFLTLLKPENFGMYFLDDIESRLESMIAIKKETLVHLCEAMFSNVAGIEKKKVTQVIENILSRREYIDKYFRTWFKKKSDSEKEKSKTNYSTFGQSFVDYYKKK